MDKSLATPQLENLSEEQKRELLKQLLARKQQNQQAENKLQRFQLSFAQRRLWFMNQLHPEHTGYHIPAALKLEGKLQLEKLQQALNQVVARQESLRCHFMSEAGEPFVVTHKNCTIAIEHIYRNEISKNDIIKSNVSKCKSSNSEQSLVEEHLRQLVAKPFDLAKDQLLRVQVLKVNDNLHYLLLCIHHIIADYTSLRILIKEISAFYVKDNADILLPQLTIQYVDYAHWQQSQIEKQDQQLHFWLQQLADLPETIPLADKPRPAVQSTQGARHHFRLTQTLTEKLQQLSQQHQVSLYVTLLSAWQSLLYRYSNQSDIIVGTTASNRDRAEVENLIGLFANNLALRAQLHPKQLFTDLLGTNKKTALDAFSNQDVPFELIVDKLNVSRRLDQHPVFQTLFVLHSNSETRIQLPDIAISGLAADALNTRFDLALDMVETAQGLSGTFEYNTDLFYSETIQQLAVLFTGFLAAIITDPNQALMDLPFSPANYQANELIQTTDTPAAIASATISGKDVICNQDVSELWKNTASQQSDKIALVFERYETENQTLTFEQLYRWAQTLSLRIIQSKKCNAQNSVAVCLPRSPQMVAALLACLDANVPYIPLDVNQPHDRLQAMLEDAQPTLALIDGGLCSELFNSDLRFPCELIDIKGSYSADDTNIVAIAAPLYQPQNLAYTIFTSGSTGRPKGVPITRGALSNFLLSMAKQPGLTNKDRLLAVTTIGFDIAALEILLPLITGATLVLADDPTSKDGRKLAEALHKNKITHMQATPATWRLLLEMGWQGSNTLTLLCGGEALEPKLASRLLSNNKGLWNLYGPTECTIWVAALQVTPEIIANSTDKLPIGGPIDNCLLTVVDDYNRPLPRGVVGELLLAGPCVSSGYINRQDLNEEKFISFSDNKKQAISAYKTGDRARLRHDGLIDFLGRVDHQIKLRGFRIEPGEIETIIAQHAAVNHCIVGLKTMDLMNDVLVAWIEVDGALAHPNIVHPDILHSTSTTESQQQQLEKDIRQTLQTSLPGYMHPSAIVFMDKFPLNSNGKVDRKALPNPTDSAFVNGEQVNGQGHTSETTVETATEKQLATLWGELLGKPVTSNNANFFDLGGHSLMAARLLARIEQLFDTKLNLKALFEHPTIGQFATFIENESSKSNQVIIKPWNRNKIDHLPLSYGQKRQWILASLEPDSPFYNIPAAVKLSGSLNQEALQQSLHQVFKRHENLRCSFHGTEHDPIAINNAIDAPAISFHSTSNEDENNVRLQLQTAAMRPFDLSKPPLLRMTVISSPQNQHVVLVVMHHILADAWSMQIFMTELYQNYKMLVSNPMVDSSQLNKLTLQYADFALWQQQQSEQQSYKDSLNYWRNQLADSPVLLDLPTDFHRPASQQFSGSSVNFTLTPQQTQKIQLQANYLQVTPFVLLLSLFKWLLHRYSESQDIVVGTPVGHRPHPDLENVIGLFANTLALRSRITGTETLAELVTTVRDVTFQGFEHQQVPFDQIVDELNVPRNWAHAPLVQVMFLWQSQSSHSLDKQTGEDSWLPFPLEHQQSKFDITLSLAEVESKIPVENATPQDTTEKHIVGKMEFRTDLYRRETISYMVDAFNQLINAALANPDKPLASHSLVSDQINRQLAQWNSTDSLIEYWRNTATQANDFGLSEYSNLIAPFQHQAHKSPNNIALEYYHQQWTYGQLDHQSNQLAHEIKRQCHFNGENPEVTIAVALPRDPRMIIAMIAILKSGAAYVPLDLNYPQERLKLILADAQPQLIIGAKPLIEEKNTSDNPLIGLTENLTINVIQLPELLPDTVLYSDLDTPTLSNTGNDKNQIAYLIYTSGSTGKPKGVTIEHQQALALINWANQTFSPQQIKGTLAATSICFDLSVFEIFVPLAMGGAIILAENALAIPELPNRNNISLINTVPSAAAELVRMKAIPDSTLVINLAGEPLSANLVRQLYENSRANAVFNLYGPSEDTTYSTGVRLARDIPLDQTVSIGRPILNTQSYVLDQHQRLIVPGMVGELYLGGAGITRGYWRQPEITAEGFIASPFGCSNRLYRTGDRVRLRHDGELEFLGRLDHQVKIRGFRIETGEIESALETHPSIQQAVVVVIEKQLTAYLRFKRAESTDASVTELRNHLMKNLPQYMIPAYFYAIDVFPSLPNGKTNRGLLTHASYTENCVLMGSAQQESGTSGDLIDSTTYQGLLQIWQKLLNRTDINPTDHFFELGGDSILAIQMITQARHQNIHLEPKDLFQYSTLETLSAFYQQSGQRQKQVIDQTPLEGEVPLLPIHHWFFEQQFHYPEHWNQTLLLKVNQAIDVTLLRKALLLVANSNDALRANFKADFIDPTTGQATHWRQFINPLMAADAVPLHSIKRSFNKTDCSEGKTPEAFIEAESNQWQAAFDLNQGPLWNILYFDLDKTTEENDSKPESIRRLLIVAHHLVIDGISWRIFLEDLQSAYLQLLNRIDLTTQDESKASLTPRTHNMVHFVSNLERVLPTFEEQRAYWQAQCAHDQARWILRAELLNQDKNDSMSHSDTITVELKGVDTQRWLKGLPQAYKILSDELLFAAVSKVLLDWNDSEKLAFMLEGHGREGLANVDLTRTFGWFTSMYPLLISAPKTQSTDEFLKSVKSSLRAVPNQGASYGALRWLSKNSQDQSLLSRANVRFNYLGQTDNLFSDDALLTPATESAGKARNPNEKREMLLDINALVAQGTLRIHWSYSKLKFQESTIQSLAHQTLDTLQYFIDHCMSDTHDGGLVPEDFPEMDLANDELDALLDNI